MIPWHTKFDSWWDYQNDKANVWGYQTIIRCYPLSYPREKEKPDNIQSCNFNQPTNSLTNWLKGILACGNANEGRSARGPLTGGCGVWVDYSRPRASWLQSDMSLSTRVCLTWNFKSIRRQHSSLSSIGSSLCRTYHHPNTQDTFVLDFVLESVTLGNTILRTSLCMVTRFLRSVGMVQWKHRLSSKTYDVWRNLVLIPGGCVTS
jgi:hypothetical protein